MSRLANTMIIKPDDIDNGRWEEYPVGSVQDCGKSSAKIRGVFVPGLLPDGCAALIAGCGGVVELFSAPPAPVYLNAHL